MKVTGYNRTVGIRCDFLLRTERKNMNEQCAQSLNNIEDIELNIQQSKRATAMDLRSSEQKLAEIEEQIKVMLKEQV